MEEEDCCETSMESSGDLEAQMTDWVVLPAHFGPHLIAILFHHLPHLEKVSCGNVASNKKVQQRGIPSRYRANGESSNMTASIGQRMLCPAATPRNTSLRHESCITSIIRENRGLTPREPTNARLSRPDEAARTR